MKNPKNRLWADKGLRPDILRVAAVLSSVLWITCGCAFAQSSSADTGSRFVSDGKGKAYLVKSDGAIYVLSGNVDSPSTPHASLTPLRTQPGIRTVTSIALGPASDDVTKSDESSNSRALYACDGRTGVLYAVDISKSLNEDALAQPVMEDEMLKGKCLVAVSETGLIAATGRTSHILLTSATQGHPIKRRRKVKELEDLTQLAFSGETLLVLRRGRVFSVDWGADASTEYSILIPVDRAAPDQTKVRRLATDRGLIYAVAQDAVFVSSFADSDNIGVAFPFVSDFASSQTQPDALRLAIRERQILSRATEVAVDGDNLLLWDGEHAVGIPRLVPAAISLEGTALQSATALNTVYRYLLGNGLLPTRTVTAAKDYDSLRQWLLELQVVLPLGRTSKEDQKTADLIETDLGRLLCTLNPNRCKEGTALSMTSGVPTGSVMTFPFVTKRSHTVVRQRELNGASLDDVVAQTAPAGTYSSWYLADLNENSLPTLEATLDRERFLMFTPFRQDLQVGSVIRTVRGEEQLIASGGDCFSTEKIQFPVALPSAATTSAGLQALPRDLSGPQVVDPAYPDISAIELKFDNPVIERIAREKLSDREVQCIPQNLSLIGHDPVFVVTGVLKVSGLRYRLLNKKRKVLHPTSAQLGKWGLAGTSDASGRWSVIVNNTYSIAYQASAPQLEVSPTRWGNLTDPSIIKRGSSQDIRSRTEGRFLIPVNAWQLDVLLPERDLRIDNSPLSRIIADAPGIYVLPAAGLTAAAQVAGAIHSVASAPTIDSVKANRSNVLSNIQWPSGQPILQGLSDKPITLAVAESDSETKSWRWQPEFVETDGVTNVFRENVKDSGLIPLSKPPTMTVPTVGTYAVGVGQVTDSDHGAYVAGLIAGRDKDVPGLLPSAGLLLINMSSASTKRLDTVIDDASTNNISVVNFSQIIPVTDKDVGLVELKKKIRKEWQSRILFVAAAGNNEGKDSGEDLDEVGGQFALIHWAPYSPQNIIGVAASDPSDDHLIKRCKPDPQDDAQRACSNFGKKFVQLTAPGYRVYALGAGSEYLLGSGTSVAAPQVAAAAAILKAIGPIGLTPNKIKARLIYTADYDEDYITDSSVWGGRLNVTRAITEPGEYVIKTNKAINSKLYRVNIDLGSTIEGLHTGELYDPEIEHARPPDSLRADQILRMHYTPNNGFWIVYVERESPWRMKMVVHANPSKADDKGKARNIRCTRMWEWKEQTKQFVEVKDSAWLVDGIPIDDILDLVGPVPESISLPE